MVIVKFATAYAADQCTKLMNNRKFRERQLKCNYWDGETDFTKGKYPQRTCGAFRHDAGHSTNSYSVPFAVLHSGVRTFKDGRGRRSGRTARDG